MIINCSCCLRSLMLMISENLSLVHCRFISHVLTLIPHTTVRFHFHSNFGVVINVWAIKILSKCSGKFFEKSIIVKITKEKPLRNICFRIENFKFSYLLFFYFCFVSKSESHFFIPSHSCVLYLKCVWKLITTPKTKWWWLFYIFSFFLYRFIWKFFKFVIETVQFVLFILSRKTNFSLSAHFFIFLTCHKMSKNFFFFFVAFSFHTNVY